MSNDDKKQTVIQLDELKNESLKLNWPNCKSEPVLRHFTAERTVCTRFTLQDHSSIYKQKFANIAQQQRDRIDLGLSTPHALVWNAVHGIRIKIALLGRN